MTPRDQRVMDASLKFEWAKQLTNNYRDLQAEFYRTNPYEDLSDSINEENGRVELRINTVPELPPQLGLIASDAIVNMRSALDIAMLELVNGKHKQGLRSAYFPIRKSEVEFIRYVERTIGPGEDRDKILDLECYPGGSGEVMVALNALANLNKHKSLSIISTSYPSIEFGPLLNTLLNEMHGQDWPELSYIFDSNQKAPLKDGDVVYSFPAEPPLKQGHEVKMEFRPCFFEPKVMPVRPVLQTLNTMLQGTHRALQAVVDLL